jgi:hypothetical protein
VTSPNQSVDNAPLPSDDQVHVDSPQPGSDPWLPVFPQTPTAAPPDEPAEATEPDDRVPSAAQLLTEAVDRAELATGLTLGVAVMAPGSTSDSAFSSGSWTSGHAWSTIKVPIAVAALTKSASKTNDALAVRAITASDNDAAKALWQSLGSSAAARQATDALLRQTGDLTTSTTWDAGIPGSSTFGMTTWTLADQVALAANFPTGTAADRVWQLMGQISAAHSWGLGQIEDAHFKGGWGPDDGGYTVRQFGQIPAADGCTAVAIAAWAPDFATGQRALDLLADIVADLSPILPSGACR